MNTYVSLDLETTGLSPQYNEIIEVGAIQVIDGVIKSKFTELIRPISYVNSNIERITGISNDMLRDARPANEVLSDFFMWLDDSYFLGYNLNFDYNFLKEKMLNLGLDITLSHSRKGIDVLPLVKKCYTFDNYKLENVAVSLGVNIGGSSTFHRASYDAIATKCIYDRVLSICPDVDSVKNPTFLDTKGRGYVGKAMETDSLPLF